MQSNQMETSTKSLPLIKISLNSRFADKTLMVYFILCDACLAVPNREFNTYLKFMYSNWMDQVGGMKNIKFIHLMQYAKAKFDLLISLGKWGTKTNEQEEIIALKVPL